ncbi:MAG: Phosphate-selective porin and superfamily protein [Acidobacteria bacterium]|nr:Phosphate-selective porin and superfamily protein [Acidobacteriota bacterium]
MVITAGDDVNLRLGVLGQFWADAINDPVADSETRNLFVRRIRLITGGQVAKRVTFFVETDAPNLGRTITTKNITPAVIVQDAFASFAAADALIIDAGLMFVPFSRNSVQSAATLLPIDYGANTFAQSAATQSSTGRDTGFQARGYLAAKHVEYRIGAFQGARDAGSHNQFRYAGRVQADLLDPEVGFFYAGTYLGKKRVVALGAAFDTQQDYHAYDADAFVDLPVRVAAVTAQFDYNRLDGDGFLPAIPRQNTYLAELGVLITPARLTPFVQFTNRDVTGTTVSDERRASVGAAFWWAAHNANVKAAYTRVTPGAAPEQHEFTLQLQLFSY